MSRAKIHVLTFEDGHVEELRVIPYDLLVVERHGGFPTMEKSLRLLHSAAVRAGTATTDFDGWAITVVDVTGEDGSVDPTPGEAPTGS